MAAMSSNPTSTTDKLIHQAALAIVSLYILTSIHHIYGGLVDGISSRLMVPPVLVVPLMVVLGLLYLYRRTDRWAILVTFSIITLIVFVFLSGLVHGAYAHTYKDLLFLLNGSPSLYYPLNPGEHYPPDNLFFEITGILEMVASGWIAYTVFLLLRDRQQRHHLPVQS